VFAFDPLVLSILACIGVLGVGGFLLYYLLKRRPAVPAGGRLDLPPPQGGPQVAERWWADFPHQDDPSRSKARPCLVIGYSGKGYWVLKCTTQAPREAHWRVNVSAGRWSPPADKDGYVDLVPFHLPKSRLQRRQGRLANGLYRQITSRLRWDRATDFIG
jgi:mRNA-degrading endonuclease toxin of MazEF toxin-antitoxin module